MIKKYLLSTYPEKSGEIEQKLICNDKSELLPPELLQDSNALLNKTNSEIEQAENRDEPLEMNDNAEESVAENEEETNEKSDEDILSDEILNMFFNINDDESDEE